MWSVFNNLGHLFTYKTGPQNYYQSDLIHNINNYNNSLQFVLLWTKWRPIYGVISHCACATIWHISIRLANIFSILSSINIYPLPYTVLKKLKKLRNGISLVHNQEHCYCWIMVRKILVLRKLCTASKIYGCFCQCFQENDIFFQIIKTECLTKYLCAYFSCNPVVPLKPISHKLNRACLIISTL